MMRIERWLVLPLLVLAALVPAPAGQAASQLRLGAVLGETADDGFARADSPWAFEFPRDHGPHPEFRSEWWYLTANLRAPNGDEFGVQFTLFRQALRAEPGVGGPWDASQIYLGHAAVTDVAAGVHLEAERLARAHPRLAGVTAAPFRAWIDGWSLTASGDDLEGLVLDVVTADFALNLRFDPVKPVALQGDQGLSAKGPGQASYYYSIPRLSAAGRIARGTTATAVTGAAWLDREWSTSVLSDDQTGWDWFALQLNSGEDLMAFQLRRRDGSRDPFDQGLWVDEAGVGRHLTAGDFVLLPLRAWRDDRGTAWPVAWSLTLTGPEGPRRLRIEAAIDDQRMDTLLTYWEGLVWVFDETGRRVGTGYLEMTGYE
jgi:predicted secreted hydrolase